MEGFPNTGKLKNRKILISMLIILFFISRVKFINYGPVFFDSPEYLRRFSMDSFSQALLAGHPPFHSGYILLFWPIFHLGQLLGDHGALLVVLAQAVLATIAIWCFFQSISFLTTKRIALFATIIASILPLWWIATDSIMMEASYVSMFIVSFYFFLLFLKKQNLAFFLISMICFFLALLTHIAVLLWTPLFFFGVFKICKKSRARFITFAFLELATAIAAAIYFISLVGQWSVLESTNLVFLSKIQEHTQQSLSLKGVVQFMRNIITPTVVNNTALIAILSVLSLFVLLKKNRKLFLFGILWIMPIIIVDHWWDSLLFGRHALLASFGLAFLVGSLLEKYTKVFFLVICYLLVVSLPAMILLRQPIPYLEEVSAVKNLPKGGLLIETHFARPQVEGNYEGKIIFVNEPGWNGADTTEQIQEFLANKQSVFITAQALSDPYGLYSGPYIHSLSLSYAHPFVMQGIISQFTLKKYKIINEKDNLLIYRIASDKPSRYPEVKKMNQSRRRIEYFDPITQLINIFFIYTVDPDIIEVT